MSGDWRDDNQHRQLLIDLLVLGLRVGTLATYDECLAEAGKLLVQHEDYIVDMYY